MGIVIVVLALVLSGWLVAKVARPEDTAWSMLACVVCSFPIFYGLVAVLFSLPSGMKGTGALPFLVVILLFISAPLGAIFLVLHRLSRRAA